MRQILEAAHELARWFLDNIDNYTPEQFAEIHVELIGNANESIEFVGREEMGKDNPAN